MKKLSLLFLSLTLLSACSSNEVFEISKSPVDILSESLTEQPKQGDIFLIQNEAGERNIYAYIEKGSEIDVEETDDNVMNIRFDEPGESDDFILYTIALENDIENQTLNFYLNGEETSVEVIYES